MPSFSLAWSGTTGAAVRSLRERRTGHDGAEGDGGDRAGCPFPGRCRRGGAAGAGGAGGRAKRPLLGCNDAWQLTIDTSTTTIVTVLMVFLISNSRNRDTAAPQIKTTN